MITKSTIDSLERIGRNDLVRQDTDDIIKQLCYQIATLKEIIDTQKEIIEDLEGSEEE